MSEAMFSQAGSAAPHPQPSATPEVGLVPMEVAGLIAADAHLSTPLHRQLLQSLPAAVYTCDAQGRITFFNRMAVELWGLEPKLNDEAFRFCACHRVYLPDGTRVLPEQTPVAAAVLRGESCRDVEVIIETPANRRFWASLSSDPVRDAAGNITGAINFFQDISQRKHSEQAIRESEERLRLATQTGKVGLWEWDITANHVSWTESLYAMHGVTPETFNATVEGFAKLVHPDDLDRVNDAIQKTVHHNAPYELELRVIRPDGRVVWLFTNARVIREHGKPTRLLGATMDITERKAVEAALQDAKETAEAANRSKDRFVAVMSHELRTPLTPVLMTVAAMQVDPELPAQFHEAVAMMRRNIELEAKLIDDLLDLSGITTGKLRLSPKQIDVNEVLKHVCSICGSQIFEKGLKLDCDHDENAGSVNADPARLQQILWNVLKNAAKFTPEGGAVNVASKRLSPERVSITIRDNGAGIEPHVLPRIFDAFEQGDPRITRQFGGLGLGLAISKALVELHGGTIRAESAGPGHGATFTIELPSSIEVELARPTRDAVPFGPKPAHAKLLVVEDHPDTARLLSRLLRASGYEVVTTHSAAGALQLAASQHFDLLISDIGLPDATGYELMQQIRAGAAQTPVKGIAMSGYGMDEDIKKSHEAGFSEHLVKPINLAQLEDAIRRILEVTT